MDALTLILTIILMLCCIALIAIILFQAGRTANASAVSGSMGNFMGKNKGAEKELFLQRATIICSIVFAVIVVVVNIFNLVK